MPEPPPAAAPSGLRAAALRSGLLAAWGSAWLAGDADLDTTAAAVALTGPQQVFGLPGEAGPAGIDWTLGWLESRGVTRLRLLLPAAGRTAGLPGPEPFRVAALGAGQAVLTLGGPPLALVPGGFGRWQLHLVEPSRWAPTPLGESELTLVAAIRSATDALTALEVARTAPGAEPAVGSLRARSARDAREVPLPDGYPPKASALIDRAVRLAELTELAELDGGAAVLRGQMEGRTRALRELADAARAAVVSGFDGYRPELWARVAGTP